MKLLRPSNRAFRVARRAGPSLAAVQAMFPTTRELGADFHCIFGTDNTNDLCQITGKRIHPNLRPYIVDGGSNYTVAPTVTMPNGAKASALLTGSGVITTLTSGGTGYPTGVGQVTVSVTGGTYAPGGHAPRFKVMAVNGSGTITSVATLDPGSGVLVPPTATFVGASGTGGVLTLTQTQGVRRINVTAGGSAYTFPPSVTVTGGTSGSSLIARAFAVLSGGAVSAVYLFDGGFGYISVPTIAFSGGGGTGAAATAVIGANVVRAVVLTDAGNQPSAPAVTLSGGDGSGASAGALMSTAAYTRSTNSITIPAGGTTDNNAQNGLLLPLVDDGEQTVFVVAKIATTGTSQIVLGSATNAGNTNGGQELKNTIGTGYTVVDYNVQLTAAAVTLPAAAVNAAWCIFVLSVAPVPGESLVPSAVRVQSSAFYARAGNAAALSVPSGERKALSRARLLGIGNCYQYGTSFRGALEVAEVFGYDGPLSTAEIDAAVARSTARMAVRGITLANT